MLRLARRLRTLFIALSLLLCLATLPMNFPFLQDGDGWMLWTYWRPLGPQYTPEQVQAHMDRTGNAGQPVSWILRAHGGRLVLERYHYGDPTLPRFPAALGGIIGDPGRPGRPMAPWQKGVFGVTVGETFFTAPAGGGNVPGSIKYWTIPVWVMTLAAAAAPAAVAWRVLRRRQQHGRRERGLCPQCGYDLRESPDLCPECGTHPNAGVEPPGPGTFKPRPHSIP